MSKELNKLREALHRVKYEAVSLADAQVIALEALTAAKPAPPGITAPQAAPEPVREAPIWNSIQIASWIGSQLMHEPAIFERSGVCKFVRSLGRHPTLLKHSPKDHVAAHQPTKEN